jgi:hypothetical protein
MAQPAYASNTPDNNANIQNRQVGNLAATTPEPSPGHLSIMRKQRPKQRGIDRKTNKETNDVRWNSDIERSQNINALQASRAITLS